MTVNFTIMHWNKTEKYLGYIIGNIVTENDIFDSELKGIEKLGLKWLMENIGIHERTTVKNILLLAKLSYRASVNDISKTTKQRRLKKIKDLI